MKYIQYSVTWSLIFFLLWNTNLRALAMNTGFSIEVLSNDEEEVFLNNFHVSLLSQEPERRGIECFDVNEEGMIAIGFKKTSFSTEKIVCVYTSDGIFQYGYQFEDYGSFGIEWDGNRVLILLVRSDAAVVVNPTGEVEDVLEISNTRENNRYWHESVWAQQKKNGDTLYTLRNDMGPFNWVASSFSQLVVTSTDGEEKVIYDVDNNRFEKTLIKFIVFLVALSVGLWHIAKHVVRAIRKEIFNTLK